MTELAGRVVLVTGAGRGLGRSYAIGAARAGAKVMVNDIDAEHADAVRTEIEGLGGVAAASHHSVADPQQAQAMVAACVDAFGALDALVNNAGLFLYGAAETVEPQEARAVIEANVLGVLNCGLAAFPRLADRGGTIVNVTSGASLGIAKMSVYGASKAAVSALTRHWAMEWAGRVTVIGLSPLADTRMARMINLPGVGPSPDETAPLVTYLLTPEARRLHGQTVRYAGGALHLLEGASFRPVGAVTAPADPAAFAAVLETVEPAVLG